jgi:hypothetical protein
LAISIKAAKGESIEDADDWRKNLKLKYSDQINKPEVTEEVANKIRDIDFKSLLQQIDNELSEFYSIFTSVQWEPSVASYNIPQQGLFVSNIDFYKEFIRVKSSFTIQISLAIQQFLYKIEVYYIKQMEGLPLYKKDFSYTEFITDQNKTDIVNAIGKFLNQFIETHGFTNKML